MDETENETANARTQEMLTLVALWNDLKVVHDAVGDTIARLRQKRYEDVTEADSGAMGARLRATLSSLDLARAETNVLRGRIFEKLGEY